MRDCVLLPSVPPKELGKPHETGSSHPHQVVSASSNSSDCWVCTYLPNACTVAALWRFSLVETSRLPRARYLLVAFETFLDDHFVGFRRRIATQMNLTFPQIRHDKRVQNAKSA